GLRQGDAVAPDPVAQLLGHPDLDHIIRAAWPGQRVLGALVLWFFHVVSFLSLGWCSARPGAAWRASVRCAGLVLELPLAFLAACHVRARVLVIPAALVTGESRTRALPRARRGAYGGRWRCARPPACTTRISAVSSPEAPLRRT